MKTLFQTSLKLAAVMLLLCGGAAITARAQGARLQIDQLDSLANRASETVDVKFDEHLMQTLPKLFGSHFPLFRIFSTWARRHGSS